MVWKYDPNDVLTDEVYPQNTFMRQSRTNTTIGKSGLYNFVVSGSGENYIWSYTDPQPYNDTEMGFLQTMYGAATSGPIDQRPPVDIWFDFAPEGDTGAQVIRPIRFSLDEESLFSARNQ